MANDNLAYDQRVVCIALKKMTKDTELIRSAFLHWNKTLSNQDFDVEKVVDELVDYLGVGVEEKKTLMLSLHSARNKLFDDLQPVPAMLLGLLDSAASAVSGGGGEAAEPADGGVAKPAHWMVTDEFLNNLTSHLRKFDKDGIADLKSALMDEGIEGLDKKLQQAVRQWASNGFERGKLPTSITEDQCYEVAHGVYMLMMDIIGPAESDRIIDKTMSDTLQIDASSRFNPRKLL